MARLDRAIVVAQSHPWLRPRILLLCPIVWFAFEFLISGSRGRKAGRSNMVGMAGPAHHALKPTKGTCAMRHFIAAKASWALQILHAGRWLGPLVVRLVFGYFWLETGISKVHNLAGFTQRFAGWGIPFPAFSAALSAWTEL